MARPALVVSLPGAWWEVTYKLVARDASQIAQMLSTIDSVGNEIARQRSRLRSTWQVHTQAVANVEAQLQAVDFTLAKRRKLLEEVVSNFGMVPDVSRDYGSVPDASIVGWLRGGENGTWAVNSDIDRAFDDDHQTARAKFIEYRRKTFWGAAKRAVVEALGRYRLRLDRLEQVRGLIQTELARVKEARQETVTNERTMAESALAPTLALARQAEERLPPPMQPWTDDSWAAWAVPEPIDGAHALYAGGLAPLEDGDLGPNARFGTEALVPLFVSLRQNVQIGFTSNSRQRAVALARSLLLRELASAQPGEIQLSFFDPIGLGQSADELLELAEYDPTLIGGKVWSSSQDLLVRLAEQTSHIELVTQKYLRSTYENIDDFNTAAGEVAEPYRLLVLFDFPTGFSDEAMGRLTSIVTNGSRCGVHTLLLSNGSSSPPYGVDPSQIAGCMRRIDLDANFAHTHQGYTLQLRLRREPETSASEAIAKRIVDGVGRAAVGRIEAAVSFDKVMGLFSAVAGRGIRPELSQAISAVRVDDPATWWRVDSSGGLFAPIGQKGAREVATLGFDSSDHSGALLVGRPGSGKSTLLHTYVGGLTTVYSPSELELYLIDFKEGVEFKSYAAEGLPHARVVAIESDREFGVSVLQSLRDELVRRGELFRSTGGQHAGLREFRTSSREPLPRILLVFDEFQVLFAKNDKVGLAAADLLETIIRQGRGFGIHVLLGSQSLSGLDALGAHVPQLLPTRILLPATELDGRRVLGDNNDAGQYLTTHGEGILNAAGGAVEANERFKGAILAEQDRIRRLQQLRDKANREGFGRRPTVFEGNASTPLDAVPATQFCEEVASTGAAPIRLRVGSPMTISGVADLELKREAGANVLAVMRDGEGDSIGIQPSAGPAYGLLCAAVASAAQSGATIDVIDFMSVDDGLDETFEPYLNSGRLTLRRRRAFGALVHELAEEVADRLDNDDSYRTMRLTVLFGVHRARELDSEIGSLDADVQLSEHLERVMRDGPEVGVHVWLWADSVGGASRRLSSRMMRECSWRVAGKMSADDSLSLLGTDLAADIRERQLVLVNDDLGVSTRAVGFSPPTRAWLEETLRIRDSSTPSRDD
jgi:S-DNA-T family DNA segregation ATPase FtsK/SpoIIIE